MDRCSIWKSIPSSSFTIDPSNIVLKDEFLKISSKRHKSRFLIATNSMIILHKDPKFNKPLKFFDLVFEIKFEIVREAPTMKDKSKPTKLSSSSREDQVKSENIESLGSIKSLIFLVEGQEYRYEVTAQREVLLKWRKFLGQRINQIGFHHLFKVFKKIGKGNFASVYLSERVEDSQGMAIKAFSKVAAYEEENGKVTKFLIFCKEGLINEIKIMRELDHPNIIKLYEVYETSNSLYMGMELVQGGQLYEYIKKKVVFSSKEIMTMIEKLLEGCYQHFEGLILGLKYMHSKNIMHRDIKLENILFKQPKYI